MIGIDTNIIIRLLTRDNADQYASAVALVEAAGEGQPLMVNPIVAAESIWVLEKRYGLKPAEARPILARLLYSVEFMVPKQIGCDNWPAWFQSDHGGFSDIVIAAINAENGCTTTYTFDRRAAKAVPGMELLT